MVGRAELLSGLFYLSAILVWTTPKAEAADARTWSRLQLLLGHKCKLTAIPLALLGFLCKEQCLLALVYLLLFELNRIKLGIPNSNAATERRPVPRTCLPPSHRRRSLSTGRVVGLALLLVSLLVAIYARFAIMHYSLPTFGRYVFTESYLARQIK